jgi:hypothetical protein
MGITSSLGAQSTTPLHAQPFLSTHKQVVQMWLESTLPLSQLLQLFLQVQATQLMLLLCSSGLNKRLDLQPCLQTKRSKCSPLVILPL